MDMDKRRKPARKLPDVRLVGRAPVIGVLVGALLGCGSVFAQSVTVTPSLDTSLTWTDNAGASGGASGGGEADWVFEVSPGISVSRTSGRLNGGLSARLRNLVYADDTDRNSSYLSLQGRGSFEAVEDLLFIDFDAGISRNNLSAFSGGASGDRLSSQRSSETRTWSIAPRLESDLRFGEAAVGAVEYSSRGISSGSDGLGNQNVETLGVRLSDPGSRRFLGWGLAYTRTDSDGGTAESSSRSAETLRGTLFANLSPQFRLRAIGGHESNDYASGRRTSGDIVGAGFDWYPTDRTSITATVEDRLFGRGYNLGLNHRMRRSVWYLSASRDLSSTAQELGPGLTEASGQACLDFVSNPANFPEITDPLDRFQLLLNCIARLTLRSNAAYVNQSLSAGFSLLGVRNTLSFSVSRADRSLVSNISSLLPGTDDFQNTDNVLTTSATVAWSHRLTGTSALDASLTRTNSEGRDSSGLETKRLLASLGLSRQLGPQTQAGLRYRYQKAEGSTDYTENAVTATLGMRF